MEGKNNKKLLRQRETELICCARQQDVSL